MILSFKKKFVPLINDGFKIHTIRKDKHNRWHKDRKIHFATGVRTKNYNCFKEGVCKSTQHISIKHYDDVGTMVYVSGISLKQDEIEKLAKNDGFESVKDFFKWFDEDFVGKIIHWADFRY